jgi:diguanylate cyclase (GGDEF)-like protein/PAS domain S-box-containing protein
MPKPATFQRKVLLVDNNPVILKMLAHFFEKEKFKVETAANGLAALKLIDSFLPDLIIVDLVMPQISGEKFCKIIRNRSKFDKVDIIILSGIVAEKKINPADFGANACIAKGSFTSITRNIKAILEQLRKSASSHVNRSIMGVEEVKQREVINELLCSRKHLETILAHNHDGVMEITSDYEIIYANNKALSILELPEEYVLSTKFTDIFQGKEKYQIKKLLDQQSPLSFLHKSGITTLINDKIVRLKIIPLIDSSYKSSIVILHDITEKTQLKVDLDNYSVRYRELFNNMHSGVAIYKMHDSGEDFSLVDFNAAAEKLDKLKREEMIGQSVDLIFPGLKDASLSDIFSQVWKTGKAQRHIVSLYRDNKVKIWRDNYVYKLPSGEIVTVYDDITEKKQAEEAVHSRQQYLQDILHTLPAAIFVIDCETRNIIDVNPAALNMIGAPREKVVGRECHNFLCPNAKSACPILDLGLTIEKSERVLLSYSGEKIPIIKSVSCLNLEGQDFLIESFIDISERKELEEKLQRVVMVDELTGILNRRGFMSNAEIFCKQAYRTKKDFFFIYADVDNLKVVNDSFGHRVGDNLIQDAASILTDTFRQTDIIGRLGGDEFAVILTRTNNLENEDSILIRLTDNIKKFNGSKKRAYHVSISLGVVRFSGGKGKTVEDLISLADKRMYENKQMKKGIRCSN